MRALNPKGISAADEDRGWCNDDAKCYVRMHAAADV